MTKKDIFEKLGNEEFALVVVNSVTSASCIILQRSSEIVIEDGFAVISDKSEYAYGKVYRFTHIPKIFPVTSACSTEEEITEIYRDYVEYAFAFNSSMANVGNEEDKDLSVFTDRELAEELGTNRSWGEICYHLSDKEIGTLFFALCDLVRDRYIDVYEHISKSDELTVAQVCSSLATIYLEEQ